MSRFLIKGGNRLSGEIKVGGAKNAVLPILAATILNGNVNIIRNCPDLSDVEATLEILSSLGCKVSRDGDVVVIDSSGANSTVISEKLAMEMRSSIIFLGPLLARFGKVTISYPGGYDTLLSRKTFTKLCC